MHEVDEDAAQHAFYYNAYSILRLLFKKKNDSSHEFVGRFHEVYPITVKNPSTNARIVGEVEFYKITNRLVEL